MQVACFKTATGSAFRCFRLRSAPPVVSARRYVPRGRAPCSDWVLPIAMCRRMAEDVDSLLAQQQVRLKRCRRAVSHKKMGSANRRKAVSRLNNLHRRIARQRSDWLHKLTTELADRHPVIALEDLRIQSMSASAAGAVEAPGRNVRAKAGLNRGILDAAWGEFARQLTYKVLWRGGRVILVDPAYTSRTCRMCSHESPENRKTQSVFACAACGHRGQSRLGRKTEACICVEAGTHRSKGLGMSRTSRVQDQRSRNPRPSGRGGCQEADRSEGPAVMQRQRLRGYRTSPGLCARITHCRRRICKGGVIDSRPHVDAGRPGPPRDAVRRFRTSQRSRKLRKE